MTDLLPCPFCGKQPLIVCPNDSYGSSLITCGDGNECPADLTVWGEPDDIDGTARIWNTRALTRQAQVSDAVRCDIESNETGCLHPAVHQGRCGYSLPNAPSQVSDDAAVERASRIGDVGSPERLLWVAGCAQRDLQAAASHSEAMPDWVRGTMSDGAEAIRQLSEALSATNSEAVSELVEAARVLAEGEFELAPDATAFEAAMDRLAKAVAKLGSRAP
jgi:hypothetical protein